MFDLTYFRVESSRPWVCSTLSPNCQYLRIVNYWGITLPRVISQIRGVLWIGRMNSGVQSPNALR
jgi:hypothetical protein